jgi:hypothetical protein
MPFGFNCSRIRARDCCLPVLFHQAGKPAVISLLNVLPLRIWGKTEALVKT